MLKTSMYCAVEISIELCMLITLPMPPWCSEPVQAEPANILQAAQSTEFTSQRQLKLAAVSGYSGDMLPPVCRELEFERLPILTYCTFKLFNAAGLWISLRWNHVEIFCDSPKNRFLVSVPLSAY